MTNSTTEILKELQHLYLQQFSTLQASKNVTTYTINSKNK